jgi:putative methyltransferase (TIGR04325 family)
MNNIYFALRKYFARILKSLKPNLYRRKIIFKTWGKAIAKASSWEDDVAVDYLLAPKKVTRIIDITSYLGTFQSLQYASLWLGKQRELPRICNFGGGAGNDYFATSEYFDGIMDFEWAIVETSKLIDQITEDKNLVNVKLYTEFANCEKGLSPNIILARGVLPFLENPYKQLTEFNLSNAKFLILDRVPIILKYGNRKNDGDNLITLTKARGWNGSSKHRWKHVDWNFNKPNLLKVLNTHWILLSEFTSIDGLEYLNDGTLIESRGFMFQKL